MAMDVSSGGVSCSEDRLAQNTAITVTIDDMTEGLLVVSFQHRDNLYQGVLFQLNRERGIPSGISFAKENVKGTATEKCDLDPSQITPLHQRHTYNNNQGTSSCNGTSHNPISQPSLRRIIKPPARFKNARMSLRLRARPVLCAKCRTLCDDKADSGSGRDEPSKDENSTTDHKTKKDRPKLGKNDSTGSSSSSTTTTTTEMNGKLRGGAGNGETGQGAPVVDPEDLRYESVGSTRVVENYWKRPLVKPLIPSSEETYARLRHKHKTPSESSGRDNRKKAKTSSSSSATSTSAHGESKLSATNSLFITKSNVCDNNFPNTRSRKALNLKMCITKIAEMRKGADGSRECGKGRANPVGSRKSLVTQRREDVSSANQFLSSPFNNHSDSSRESTTEVIESNTGHQDKTSSDEGAGSSSSAILKARGSSKKSKGWGDRIRTKSTVPVRFRDESYLQTKNIFNFNKRRPPGSNGGGEIPVLTISRNDDENTFKVSTVVDSESTDNTVTTSRLDELPHGDDDDDDDDGTPIESAQSSPAHEESYLDNQNGDQSRHSPSSSSTLNEASQPPANLSIKSNVSKISEPIKTPTIKITFGSSGNGMVVQIPPKITQTIESPSTTDLKAVRKAMKKAKKEAKRRRSMSPDFSPSANAFSPEPPLKIERSSPISPVTPALSEPLEESDISQHHDDKSVLAEYTSSEPSVSVRLPKKKKKQKKRRRNSKVLKENDGFTSSSSSHDPLMVNSTLSPHSTSSCNQDTSYGSQESPGATSVKSCNLLEPASPLAPNETTPFGDNCTPRRRRSMPATSTTSNTVEAPRVCINLKRIDTNAYVPLPHNSFSSHSDNDDPSENNGMDTDEAELNEFPVNNEDNARDSEASLLEASGQSVQFYKDKESDVSYQIGDIVWGKLPACPWWPGKIDDILRGNGEETRAKVSWYKSTTQSCMRFKMIVPFTEYFESKYTRTRRRGLYQHAVKDALVEAHRLNPQDSPID